MDGSTEQVAVPDRDRSNEQTATPAEGGAMLAYATPGRTFTASRPRPPLLCVIFIGLALLPLMLTAAYPLAKRLPYGWHARSSVYVPTARPSWTGEPSYFWIGVDGSGWGKRTRMESAQVVYAERMPQCFLTVDLRSITCRLYRTPRKRQRTAPTELVGRRPLTRASLIDYMVREGFDRADPNTAAAADALLGELRALSRPPPDRHYPALQYVQHEVSGRYFFGYGLWLPWYTPLFVPLWLFVWRLVSRPILRRYRRRLAIMVEACQTP